MPEFPNFFILCGPNTNICTGGSISSQDETCSQRIVECINLMITKGIAAIEARESVCDSYDYGLMGGGRHAPERPTARAIWGS